jgi:putative transposase
VRLQQGTYADVRARFHLSAQMACSVPRQVGATCPVDTGQIERRSPHKGMHQETLQRARHPTTLRFAPLTYQYKKDYSFKRGQAVSILTLDGRVVVPYTGYNTHVALIQKGAEIGAAKWWYDQPKKRFYLLVSLEVETPDPTPETHTSIVGVDVGIRQLAVTSTSRGKATFYPGTRIVPRANHSARSLENGCNRKALVLRPAAWRR